MLTTISWCSHQMMICEWMNKAEPRAWFQFSNESPLNSNFKVKLQHLPLIDSSFQDVEVCFCTLCTWNQFSFSFPPYFPSFVLNRCKMKPNWYWCRLTPTEGSSIIPKICSFSSKSILSLSVSFSALTAQKTKPVIESSLIDEADFCHDTHEETRWKPCSSTAIQL